MKAIALLLATLLGCSQPLPPAQDSGISKTTVVVLPCRAQGPLPDHACTLGTLDTEATLEVICGQSTRERRHVTDTIRQLVFEKYDVPYPVKPGTYEVDHLIPLELGGSNDISNLWPEAADPRPGFREKDLVENELHRRVCSGEETLQEAQWDIAFDWVTVYRGMLGER